MGLMDNDVDMQSVENRFKSGAKTMAFEKRQMIRKVVEHRVFYEVFTTTDSDQYIQKGIDEGRTEIVRFPIGKTKLEILEPARLMTEIEQTLFIAQNVG